MRLRRTLAVAVVALLGGRIVAADDPPSYIKDVKPFLVKYCMDCHNNTKAKSGYSVESFDRLLRRGRKGALVVAEKPDESRLLLCMAGKGKPMPPRNKPQPSAEEITRVRNWVKAGAKDDTPAADDRKKGDDRGR